MTAADLGAVLKGIAPVVREFIAGSVESLTKRLEAVEARPVIHGKDGERGPQGEKGLDGLRGEPGPIGEKGLDGAAGPMGERGERGEPGQKGLDGIHGKDGRDGIDGKDGAPGPSGERGEPGPIGAKGLDGQAGERGAAGESGPAGPAGEQGPQGADGAPGEPGPVGPAGERGPVGERGEPGQPGPVGTKGIDGERGERGPDGPQGIAGRDGLPGVQGPAGEKGIDGRHGIDGIHGKDGLGFDDLSVLHDGERGFTFQFSRGDQVKSFAFTIPCVIYRGLYGEDRDPIAQPYEKGDSVTFDGCQWIAKESTSLKPDYTPASSKVWRLSVKVGRKGKDADPAVIEALVNKAVAKLPKSKAQEPQKW